MFCFYQIACSKENDIIRSRTLSYSGRNVTYEKTCGQVIDATFEELCDRVCILTLFQVLLPLHGKLIRIHTYITTYM